VTDTNLDLVRPFMPPGYVDEFSYPGSSITIQETKKYHFLKLIKLRQINMRGSQHSALGESLKIIKPANHSLTNKSQPRLRNTLVLW